MPAARATRTYAAANCSLVPVLDAVRKSVSCTSPLPVGRWSAPASRWLSRNQRSSTSAVVNDGGAPRSASRAASLTAAGTGPVISVPAASGSTAAPTSCSGPGCGAYQPSR